MARRKKRSTNNTTNTTADIRPLAKGIMKQALRAYDAAKEVFTEAGEQFENLVNEARAEMKGGKPPTPAKKKRR